MPPLADISPMSRRFDHIDLRVPDLTQVTDFYRKLLPALGFKRTSQCPAGFNIMPKEKARPNSLA